MFKNILVYCALAEEANPLITQLGLAPVRSLRLGGFACEQAEGLVGQTRVRVVYPALDPRFGLPQIGAEPAAVVVAFALAADPPDLVFNTGTAGAVSSSGLKVGEIVVVDGVSTFLDRKSAAPVFTPLLTGSYPLHHATDASLQGISRARLGTGGSFVFSPEECAFMTQAGIGIKDMEAASVAWVCHANQVPLMIVKVVSDHIDGPTGFSDEFFAHLKRCSADLAVVTSAWIRENGCERVGG